MKKGECGCESQLLEHMEASLGSRSIPGKMAFMGILISHGHVFQNRKNTHSTPLSVWLHPSFVFHKHWDIQFLKFPCSQFFFFLTNGYYFSLIFYYVQITYTLSDAATCTDIQTHMLTPEGCLCLLDTRTHWEAQQTYQYIQEFLKEKTALTQFISIIIILISLLQFVSREDFCTLPDIIINGIIWNFHVNSPLQIYRLSKRYNFLRIQLFIFNV